MQEKAPTSSKVHTTRAKPNVIHQSRAESNASIHREREPSSTALNHQSRAELNASIHRERESLSNQMKKVLSVSIDKSRYYHM